MAHRAAIALGANLGDRAATLKAALARVRAHPRIQGVVASRMHETAPVGGPAGQPAYLNAAAVLETDLAPEELLAALLEIERDLGRDRRHEVRFGPRTIDLDVLLYDQRVIDEPHLTVPHPRLHERAFVLDPLVEVAADWVHPVLGKRVAELQAAVHAREVPIGKNMSNRIDVLPTIAEARAWRKRVGARRVAFVPTMGALHEGHASLVRQARRQAGADAAVAASVFVNPTQFGPNEDFNKYPRTLDADCRILEAAGCDVVFAPTAADMYPGIAQLNTQHAALSTSVDPGPLAAVLEGAIRPGHFRGVCTVVLKLLNIVQPDELYMGQKDYQQNAVLRVMLRELNVPTEHVMCPTVREPDGLALSSRNRYLSADERTRAAALHEALSWAKAAYDGGTHEGSQLAAGMHTRLAARGLAVQYAVVANARTLDPIAGDIADEAVLLVAAVLGSTRLIDNMLLNWTIPAA